MKFSKRLTGSLILVLVLALSGAGIYYRITSGRAADDAAAAAGAGEVAPADSGSGFDADMPIPVEGATVVQETLVLSVSAAGEAASFRSTVLRAQVAGQVRAVHVRENAGAAAGQVLLEIDPTEYELNLQEAKASYARAEATYREQLVFDERIADAAVRAEREKNARARSGLDGALATVRRAELNLARTHVVAPFAGRIANVMVVTGQYLSPGDELATVQQMDPLEVEVQVLEGEIGFIVPGRGATLAFAAFPGETFTGVVESVNPVVDQKTRTARVSVSVRNPRARLLPGMYARVALAAQRLPDRLLVPRTAILERDHKNLLFVFEGEGDTGLAKWRYVTTGLHNDRLVEVIEGPETELVKPGEIVLVDGHQTLMHDARVRLTTDSRAEGGRPQ
jgi:HlyD family secretion protein